jgi:hypothetical protein
MQRGTGDQARGIGLSVEVSGVFTQASLLLLPRPHPFNRT